MFTKSYYLIIVLLGFVVAGCSNNKGVKEAPASRKDTVVTNYFGTQVSDPFRWLEDNNDPEVQQWIADQNKYADNVLSGFPDNKKIEERIKELEKTGVEQYSPKLMNNQLYFMQITPPQPQAVVATKSWPDGETKVLVDPNKMGSDIAITGFWPSPNGNYLAYTTAEGGTEAATIHVRDLKSGNDLHDSLVSAGGGATPAGMAWDEDGKGLTYVRLPLPGTVPDSISQFNAALYHHTLGQPQESDKLVFGKDLSKVAEYTFIPSEDGRQAAMFVHFGDGNPDYVYIRHGRDEWKQVLDTSANVRVSDEINSGAAWDEDGNLLLVAYDNAPLGKLLSVKKDGAAKVVVPEGEWAYNSVAAIRHGFLLTKVKGPDWKIDQYDKSGKLVKAVGLRQGGIGINAVVSSPKSDNALITYEGWTFPERWDTYNADTGNLNTIFQMKPAADYSNIKYSLIEATSNDGTKIPVTVVRMDGITPNGQRPTIVYGYGGFGITRKPHFIGPYLVWLENGGVFAFTNLRGGGEYGEGWHAAGMLGNKQNVFDDMYAATQAMEETNWTDKAHLGIMGGSNGGLLMGALLTQHPDAFKAVVSFVGIYDMIRNELFPNGQYNISEYGSATNPESFQWLYAYSPYHHVKPNTNYPAVMLETGMNDPRVASWQSRKFAAALQDANTSDNPIILITRMNEGHGVTASFSQRVGNLSASMTFFAHELGLKLQ